MITITLSKSYFKLLKRDALMSLRQLVLESFHIDIDYTGLHVLKLPCLPQMWPKLISAIEEIQNRSPLLDGHWQIQSDHAPLIAVEALSVFIPGAFGIDAYMFRSPNLIRLRQDALLTTPYSFARLHFDVTYDPQIPTGRYGNGEIYLCGEIPYYQSDLKIFP